MMHKMRHVAARARSLSAAASRRRIPIYQIDSFASKPFSGNPAAVCMLEKQWLSDSQMLDIASENNLAETAFVLPRKDCTDYDLRWFTPTLEVDMCGHATLASGAVILERMRPDKKEVGFHTRSGRLVVRRDPDGGDDDSPYYTLDFPLWPIGVALEPTPKLVHALCGGNPPASASVEDTARLPWPLEAYTIQPLHGAPYVLYLYENESAVRALAPMFLEMDANVVATAPADVTSEGSEQFDFVSRFFGPLSGIPEDPVTGSAHMTLAPFWADRLGKRSLVARQVSQRGGTLRLVVEDERVLISGPAALYMEGTLCPSIG